MSVVADRLTMLGVSFEVIPHEHAYTPIDEALALGISADEVLKTIVLDTASGHTVARSLPWPTSLSASWSFRTACSGV